MKTSLLLATTAVAAFAFTGAQAEEYHGVLQFQSSVDRTAVRSQAVQAANRSNPYAEAALAGVAPAMASPRDRASVYAEAVERAHRPNQNLRVEAFANSRVPSYYDMPSRTSQQRQAGNGAGGTTVR
ncbi:hypothetical protein LJR290_007593 [Variovorax sp. LjRoot290]|uniref:hypothetical protein n=1 Tax=Variovorax sp. LjRoot290 TaxID=3342316 RepID=UPI003ECE6B9B